MKNKYTVEQALKSLVNAGIAKWEAGLTFFVKKGNVSLRQCGMVDFLKAKGMKPVFVETL